MTKERKYLIVCGVVLLLAGFVYRFYPFNMGTAGSGLSIELKQKKIAKYSSTVKNRAAVEKHLESLKKKIASSSGRYLAGTTPALAAVDIQNIIGKIAEKTGVGIDRVDVKKEKKKEDSSVVSIPVRFTVTTTTRQLRDMIYWIESSEKLLRIIELSSTVGKIAYPEQIRTNVTVEGFFLEQ